LLLAFCRLSAKERQLAEIGVVDRPAARTELRPAWGVSKCRFGSHRGALV